MSRTRFVIFPRKKVEIFAAANIERVRIFWQVVPVQQAGTVRQRRRPYKLGDLRADST